MQRSADPIDMVVQPSLAEDSDQNGFVDAFSVTVYLFPPPKVSKQPVWAEGTLEFELNTAKGEPLGRWTVAQDDLRQYRARFAPGPAYNIGLGLLPGEDVIEAQEGRMLAWFVSAQGRRVELQGPRLVMLGPVAGASTSNPAMDLLRDRLAAAARAARVDEQAPPAEPAGVGDDRREPDSFGPLPPSGAP